MRLWYIAVAVAISGCAGDGPTASVDDDSSVVIVTTTTTSPNESSEPTDPTDPRPAPTEPATSPTATTPTPGTTAPTPDEPPTTAPTPVVGDPNVSSELVLEADLPLDLVVRPGDPSLFIVEQRGTIRRADPLTGDSVVVFDISGRLSDGNEQGLLGLAFSPDTGRAYVDFTDPAGTTTIAEYTVASDGTFDQSTERIVITVDQPYGNHNAGDLEFGPDGLLYVTLGDGGSGGDPERRASDPRSLLGSLLRIDPAPSADRGYTVPPDNPFADGPLGDVDGAPEVWAWGLRNPWKIAFDPITGDLWIADVGQNRYEEINRVAPTDRTAGYAVDFGWSAFEGTERFNDDVPGEGVTFPVVTYEHGDDGCSVSGGVPYRGNAIPELEPAYVYSDICSGKIWAVDLEGGRVLTLLDGFDQVTAVRAGPDREIYVLERSGGVHRLVAG